MFLRQDPRLSIPRNDQYRPRSTTQDAFADRSLSEPPPSSSPVGSQNDDVDFPGVCMKHDHGGRITVLLFDAHFYACCLCALPKISEVFKPLACSRGESNVGRGCVKHKQLGVADHCEPDRTVKRWFARLLEINCAENTREVPHAITPVVIRSVAREPEDFSDMCLLLLVAAEVCRESPKPDSPSTSSGTGIWPAIYASASLSLDTTRRRLDSRDLCDVFESRWHVAMAVGKSHPQLHAIQLA